MSPTNDWTYASRGGVRYPVQPGELWGLGEHRILCGDLERGAADRVLEVTGARPALVYTDPPWNPGVHRSFRTKAGLGEAASFDDLQRGWLSLSAVSAPITLVEMGKTGLVALRRVAAECLLVEVMNWQITYFKRDPAWLLAFVPSTSIGAPPFPDFTGFDDSVTPGMAVDALTDPGEDVVDFCTGLGHTAEAAARRGRRFIGSELHPNRVSATLHRLTSVTGIAPQRVDILPDLESSPIYGG